MIKLSNGHCLEFLTASGALAFDGRGWPWEWLLRWLGFLDPHLFTIVVKTLLPEKWLGNLCWFRPWDVVKFITKEGKEINPVLALTMPRLIDGVINAIGLTGPGIDGWLERDYPVIQGHGYKVIVSITGPEGGKGCVEMAKKLNSLKNVVGIEFNASCPNTAPVFLEDAEMVVRMCYAIKEVSEYPLLLKLSYAQLYLQIAKKVKGIVEGISINTVPWKVIFPDKISPLLKYGGGGVSGPAAQPFIWKMISELRRATSIPIIGAGIWEYEDIRRLRSLGALACHFGTISLPWPCKPTRFVRRWRIEHD